VRWKRVNRSVCTVWRIGRTVQPRREPNVSYRLLRAIYPAFRVALGAVRLFVGRSTTREHITEAVEALVRGYGALV